MRYASWIVLLLVGMLATGRGFAGDATPPHPDDPAQVSATLAAVRNLATQNTPQARKQALADLDRLLEAPADQLDPWLGEILLARVWLQLDVAPSTQVLNAMQHDLERAIQWQRNTAPAQPPTTPGHLHPALVGPEDQINAHTAAWYAPLLGLHARLLHAWILVELEDFAQAAATLNDLEPEKIPGSGLCTQRLNLLRQQVAKGQLGMARSSRARLTGDDGWQLKRAFFLLTIAQPQQAQRIFTSVYQHHREGHGELDLWAACEIGLAMCDLANGRTRQAITRLQRFDGILGASHLGPQGLLILATTLVRSPDRQRDGLRHLIRLTQQTHCRDVATLAERAHEQLLSDAPPSDSVNPHLPAFVEMRMSTRDPR